MTPIAGPPGDPDYPGTPERAIVFTVETWDINCPQHIHPRYSQRQVQPVIEQLQHRIRELEDEWRSSAVTKRNSIRDDSLPTPQLDR